MKLLAQSKTLLLLQPRQGHIRKIGDLVVTTRSVSILWIATSFDIGETVPIVGL
jgi:hypothetical protein